MAAGAEETEFDDLVHEELEGAAGAAKIVRSSPDGRHVATLESAALRVIDVSTMDVVALFAVDKKTEIIEWSPDNNSLLSASLSSKTDSPACQVWDLSRPSRQIRIREGDLGLSGACWSPNGEFVITIADMRLNATAWKINSGGDSLEIQVPKHPTKGLGTVGEYLVVLGRRGGKDELVSYSESMDEVGRVELSTRQAEQVVCGVSSASGPCVVTVDGPPYARCLVHAVPSLHPLQTIEHSEASLALRTPTLSPLGRYLALGDYDVRLRVYDTAAWSSTVEYTAFATVRDTAIQLWQEKHSAISLTPATDSVRLPIEMSKAVASASVPPKMGFGYIAWTPSETYMVARNDAAPKIAWIYHNPTRSLHSILCMEDKIVSLNWSPGEEDRLCISTGGGTIALWTEKGVSTIPRKEEDSNKPRRTAWVQPNILLLYGGGSWSLLRLG